MPKEDFYSIQTGITAAKIKFYQEYIGGYLIKLLMAFGECFIADLFCGPGKNGDNPGSPLILLEQAKKMLASHEVKKRHKMATVKIIFNDIESKHIENLKAEIQSLPEEKGVKILEISNKPFSKILDDLSGVLESKIPKFFFLDPFAYRDVTIGDIGKIINSPYTEMLFFLPAQDVYRFAATDKIPDTTKNFLNNFTTKGIYAYSGIEDFNASICQKFRKTFDLKFVRPILLNSGPRKHTLFLLTRHIRGILLANKIFWDKSPDGLGIRSGSGEPHLFNTGTCRDDFQCFKGIFENALKSQGSMNNRQIIEFTASYGFLGSHTREILDELKKAGKIRVKHLGSTKRGYHIAENNWDKLQSIIEYIR